MQSVYPPPGPSNPLQIEQISEKSLMTIFGGKLDECTFVKVEPAGPGHRAAVHHGNHSGENRGGLTSHKPHHHPDHESTADSARYKSIPTWSGCAFKLQNVP